MSLPILEATACFLRKENKTLFIDYKNYPHPLHRDKVAPSGGKIEPGETPEQAVIREIKEEMGIIVHSLSYKGEVLFRNEGRMFGDKPAKNNYLVYFYETSDFDDSQARAKEGELVWLTDSEFQSRPAHKTDLDLFPLFRKYKTLKAEVLSGEKVNLISHT